MLKENLDIFLYWIKERHSIYLKKEVGKPWPWTKDTILQEYKFTNPFRQNDRVTKELTKHLNEIRNSNISIGRIEAAFQTIIIFRMFNWPPTYEYLASFKSSHHNFLYDWGRCYSTNMIKVLKKYKQEGNKVFTGAYMMTGSGSSGEGGKINIACKAIDRMIRDREKILREINDHNTIQHAVTVLSRYPMVGKFVAYEFACDMRHTSILNKASDIYTWANPGPGAKRGIHRLLFDTPRGDKPKRLTINNILVGAVDYQKEMQELMAIAQKKLDRLKIFKGTKFEMRDIEHSLCEFDKYMRVKNGEGRPRSKYKCIV